jgi:glucose-1-phosphate adenylyltransferase
MSGETLTIILAGGHGNRLLPLTEHRAKAAVPFGGKYRIIDFTLANCLHSGLRQVLVLTQYKSHSLQKHLRDGWSLFNPELGEYITPVPPQMRDGRDWYVGTANAIYQNRYLLERSKASRVLILRGDHIYRMDYAELIKFHKEKQAEVTLAYMPIEVAQAGEFGVLAVDAEEKVIDLTYQPPQPRPSADNPREALVSMGAYLFEKGFLLEALASDHANPDSSHDFCRDLLPSLVGQRRSYGYRFGGARGRVSPDRYWRDLSTLDAYYEANMALLDPVPPLDLYQEDWTIHTYQGQYPPARTVPGPSGNEGIFVNSILAAGTVISGGGVNHSILFPQVWVEDRAIVEDAIVFSRVRVGAGAHLRRCILDKDVIVPPGTRIGFDRKCDRERFTLSEGGVVVVPRGYRF